MDAEDHEVAVGTIDDVVVGYGLVAPSGWATAALGVVDDIYVDPGARASASVRP